MADYDLTFSSVSIPTNSGGASVTVEEDSNTDGTTDTTETITLSNGTTSYSTTSDAFAGSGQVALSFDLGPPTDVTVTVESLFPATVEPQVSAPTVLITTTVGTTSPTITDRFRKISGKVTLNGNPVQGAKIIIVNMTQEVLEAVRQTDSNGDYSAKVPGGSENAPYHVAVQYEDGSEDKYNDDSKPYIK